MPRKETGETFKTQNGALASGPRTIEELTQAGRYKSMSTHLDEKSASRRSGPETRFSETCLPGHAKRTIRRGGVHGSGAFEEGTGTTPGLERNGVRLALMGDRPQKSVRIWEPKRYWRERVLHRVRQNVETRVAGWTRAAATIGRPHCPTCQGLWRIMFPCRGVETSQTRHGTRSACSASPSVSILVMLFPDRNLVS